VWDNIYCNPNAYNEFIHDCNSVHGNTVIYMTNGVCETCMERVVPFDTKKLMVIKGLMKITQ